jgi:methionyl-tRNA formyltransferase
MKFCLLSSPPLITIHILYYTQTQGIKFDDVVIVGDGGEQYNLLRECADTDHFNLHFIDDPNSNEGITLMKSIAPDVVGVNVLNILRKAFLKIPKVATVNIHTGILPQFRGLDSRRWAILEGGAVGVSAHLVDEGLDTGEILARRELELQPGDTIDTITNRNYYTNKWQVFTEALLKVQRGEIRGIKQEISEGKQYFIMHPKLAKVVDLILESRVAKTTTPTKK